VALVVTSTELAAWLGVADSAAIQGLNKVAHAIVGKYCGGRAFDLLARTEYPRGRGRVEFVDGVWRSWLLMREWPIVSVASVWIDAAGAFGTGTEIDVDDIVIDGNKLILSVDVPEGLKVAKVTYTAGYDVTGGSLPDAAADLGYAIKQQAAALYRQGSSERMKSESMGAYSYTRFGGESIGASVDPSLCSILAPYRA
jgi:hypothetical protein